MAGWERRCVYPRAASPLAHRRITLTQAALAAPPARGRAKGPTTRGRPSKSPLTDTSAATADADADVDVVVAVADGAAGVSGGGDGSAAPPGPRTRQMSANSVRLFTRLEMPPSPVYRSCPGTPTPLTAPGAPPHPRLWGRTDGPRRCAFGPPGNAVSSPGGPHIQAHQRPSPVMALEGATLARWPIHLFTRSPTKYI